MDCDLKCINCKELKKKINLRRLSNHKYPTWNIVGSVSCDHHALYSVGGVRDPDCENWPVKASVDNTILRSTVYMSLWGLWSCLDLWKCVCSVVSFNSYSSFALLCFCSFSCVDRAGSLTRHVSMQSEQIYLLLASFCLHSLQLASLVQD
jgi:hypothetical protein